MVFQCALCKGLRVRQQRKERTAGFWSVSRELEFFALCVGRPEPAAPGRNEPDTRMEESER